MFTGMNPDGSVGETMVFASGWLNKNGEYDGRPVDVAQMKDGSILVSDDFANAISASLTPTECAFATDRGQHAAAPADRPAHLDSFLSGA